MDDDNGVCCLMGAWPKLNTIIRLIVFAWRACRLGVTEKLAVVYLNTILRKVFNLMGYLIVSDLNDGLKVRSSIGNDATPSVVLSSLKPNGEFSF